MTSRIFQEVMIPKTLEDYCRVRRETVELVKQAHDVREQANAKMAEVYPYGLGYVTDFRESLKTSIKDIDQKLWRRAFDATNFSQLMDATAKRQFEDSLDRDPPEFNEDNVRSIFLSAAQDADMMFIRGLIEVFRWLSPSYKTNQKNAFKVERKVVLTYMLQHAYRGGLEVRYGRSCDQLNDIDRVIKTLDDKIYTPRSFETVLNGAFKEGEIFEDEYYRAKGFKNGNIHLEFKRADLLEKANKLIAEHYGAWALAKEAA